MSTQKLNVVRLPYLEIRMKFQARKIQSANITGIAYVIIKDRKEEKVENKYYLEEITDVKSYKLLFSPRSS